MNVRDIHCNYGSYASLFDFGYGGGRGRVNISGEMSWSSGISVGAGFPGLLWENGSLLYGAGDEVGNGFGCRYGEGSQFNLVE